MEAESKLASAGADDAARRDADDVVAALRRLVMVNDRQRDFLAEATRQLNRWVADAGAAASARDWRERLADGWVTLRDSLRAVWNFELFAVEDSAVIDGQTVATSRGVTVGKSIGAVLLFLVGYGVVARLARAFSARLVAQGHDAARVRTVRRWLLAITAAVLAVLTLNVARIPLHVFAFMGGALAIGVGFGMQTIIKNLISGMIVLAERRIQIGDIVDVDGINGTVTTVDLRSTTVRSFDGLETMVPNSTLLENKVTNWTMSDRHVRRVVRVGVAYGTRMREAADLLEACARRHGNVLDDPAPYVLFEDFGDNAQTLALHFWVELLPRVSAAQVASDLRFMIEKQFAENGIVIAYPQRDVHLDTAQPLRVEVVGEK
jgi:potassium-dependent mechanosensitive channel